MSDHKCPRVPGAISSRLCRLQSERLLLLPFHNTPSVRPKVFWSAIAAYLKTVLELANRVRFSQHLWGIFTFFKRRSRVNDKNSSLALLSAFLRDSLVFTFRYQVTSLLWCENSQPVWEIVPTGLELELSACPKAEYYHKTCLDFPCKITEESKWCHSDM